MGVKRYWFRDVSELTRVVGVDIEDDDPDAALFAAGQIDDPGDADEWVHQEEYLGDAISGWDPISAEEAARLGGTLIVHRPDAGQGETDADEVIYEFEALGTAYAALAQIADRLDADGTGAVGGVKIPHVLALLWRRLEHSAPQEEVLRALESLRTGDTGSETGDAAEGGAA